MLRSALLAVTCALLLALTACASPLADAAVPRKDVVGGIAPDPAVAALLPPEARKRVADFVTSINDGQGFAALADDPQGPTVGRLMADGTYARILAKWGTTSSSLRASQINPPEPM